MTTSEPAPLFSRAENASRRWLLVICLGALAWGVGSLLATNLEEWLALEVQTGLGAIVEHWCFERLWLVLTLTPMAFAAGRFLGGAWPAFVLPAALTGEVFSASLAFLRDGSPWHSWEDVAAGFLSLALGLIPAALSFEAGRRAFARAEAQSLQDAAARKAEYDAFLAKAKGDERPPA